MNLPEIYLVEPYNAYTSKPGRKKHWHDVIEEQALFARMLAEQQAIMEANSRTLPPNSPPTSGPTVGNAAGGAGGQPPPQFFNPQSDVIDFTATPLLGDAPLTVQFTNLTTTQELDTYLWLFGDGTTSTDANPTHVYQSGSNDGLGYTASLQVSNSVTLSPGGIKTRNGYITASIPTVTALFTYITSSGPGPVTVGFRNESSTTSQTPPTLTYLWNFGDSNSSILESPSDHNYANTGSFTASLQATGSYGIASKYTQSFFIPAPTLVAAFTYTTSSGPGPITGAFASTTTYNGNGDVGNLTYKWIFGDGYSSSLNPASHFYSNTGSYTSSLQVTESLYGITSTSPTQSFYVPAPTLTVGFTFTTSSDSAPSTTTFLNTTVYDGNGGGANLTYLWDLGSGSLSASTIIPNPQSYTVAGNYTASLQVTESLYGIKSLVTHSWTLT